MKTKLSEFPTPPRPAQTPGAHADSHQTTALQSPPPNPPATPSAWTFPDINRQKPDQKPGGWQFYAAGSRW